MDGDAAVDCCLAFLLRKHSQDNESCAFDLALASSLLALRLFELPRSRRVTNQPGKRAVPFLRAVTSLRHSWPIVL